MNFILAAAAIPALLWGFVWLTRGSVILGCALYLVLSSTFGPQFYSFDIGFTLSIDRLLLPAVVVAFLWQQKFSRQATKQPLTAPDKWLAGFVGLMVINTFAHDWQRDALDQVPIVQHLIEGYLLPMFLYVVASRSKLDERTVNRLFAIFGVFGVYLAITAMSEVAGVWSLVFPKYIADPDLGIHFGRARGPFLQSVRLGMYLLVGLGSIWIPLVYRKVWGREGRVLGLLLSALMAAAIVATFTRSIWMALMVAFFLLVLMTFEGRWRRATAFGIVVTLLAGFALNSASIISLDREDGAEATTESTSMRAVFAYVSWLMFMDDPITGCGFGHFPHVKDNYLQDRETRLRLDSIRGYIHHNTYLSLLVELGIGGLILISGLFFALTRNARRLWRDTKAPPWRRDVALLYLLFFAAFAIQMLFHEVSYSPVEFGLFFLLAGLMSCAVAAQAAEQDAASPAQSTTAWPGSFGQAALN